MSKLHQSLLMMYLAAAAGYGGWRGRDLLSDWSLLWFLIPPLAFGLSTTFLEWRRNPYWISIKLGLVMTVFAVAVLGGTALILAWLVSEMTAKWGEPILRAIFGFGMVAFVGVSMGQQIRREQNETIGTPDR